MIILLTTVASCSILRLKRFPSHLLFSSREEPHLRSSNLPWLGRQAGMLFCCAFGCYCLPSLVHSLRDHSAGPFRPSLEECMPSKVTTLPSPPETGKAVLAAAPPTEEQIALRAHQIFLERGAAPGSDLDDWLQAERELTAAAKSQDARRSPAQSTAASAKFRSRT